MMGSRATLICLVAVLLAGCAAPQAPIPDQTYFRLAPEAQSGTRAAMLVDGLLMVEELRADGLHGERALLYSEDAKHRQLRQYHYEHWVDPPTRLIQTYLVQRLRAAGAAPQVMRYNISDKGDAFLGGRVERFEQLIEGQQARVIVDLELRLSYPGEAHPRLLRDYRTEVTLAGTSPEATIAGFETALNRIVGEFLSDAAQVAGTGTRGGTPRGER